MRTTLHPNVGARGGSRALPVYTARFRLRRFLLTDRYIKSHRGYNKYEREGTARRGRVRDYEP